MYDVKTLCTLFVVTHNKRFHKCKCCGLKYRIEFLLHQNAYTTHNQQKNAWNFSRLLQAKNIIMMSSSSSSPPITNETENCFFVFTLAAFDVCMYYYDNQLKLYFWKWNCFVVRAASATNENCKCMNNKSIPLSLSLYALSPSLWLK